MSHTRESLLDPVRQFSVYVENKVGRLNELIAVLASHEVHVLALTILDTTDSAILRLVLDDPERGRELLAEHGFHFSEIVVLAVELDGPEHLRGLLAVLLEAEINIHYLYAFVFRPAGKLALVASVDDRELATQALSRREYRVLGQADIAR